MKFVIVLAVLCFLNVAYAQNSTCVVCETVVKGTEFLVNVMGYTNATQIEEMIEQDVCPLMGQYSAECVMFVKSYLAMIIEEIIKGEDPDTICKEMGFCATPPKKIANKPLKGKKPMTITHSGPERVN